MPYYLLLYSLIFLSACQSVSIPESESEVIEPVDTFSNFDLELLTSQHKTQESIAQELYLKSLPKLPGDNSFFGKVQLNAIESGSRKSLQKEYRRITVPNEIHRFEKIKHLNLSNQNIHFIPNKIGRYPNLQYLSLSNNRIQAINPILGQCKKLRKLDLSSNGIKSIPFGMIYVTQIEELVLADNHLSTLPSFLINLRRLKSIDISNAHTAMAEFNNNFKKLPKVLLNMPQIEKLFLDKLALRTLPSNINKMKGLKVVSLNGARMLNLTQAFNALSTVPDLIALDISFIGRRTLPPNIKKLKGLKVLIWHEEKKMNRQYVLEKLKLLLPNTKIYFGDKGVATPFLRGNSITTIRNAGLK